MNLIFAVMVFAVMAMQPKCANSAEVAEVRYPVEVISCHDADTCLVHGIPMPDPLSQEWPIRLAGIQAPEVRGSKCPTAEGRAHETRLALDATAYVQKLVRNRKAYAGLVGMGGFDRLLAKLYVEDDGNLIDVGQRLVDVGLATPWNGLGTKPAFCK